GLHEDREAERVLDRIPVTERDVPRDRDSLVAHDCLEQVLVHAECGGGHPRADVGDAGQLEQALDGSVLPEGTVQDRQHDFDLVQGGHDSVRRDRNRQRLSRTGPGAWHLVRSRSALPDRGALVSGAERPVPVPPDLDRHCLVTLGVECLQHRTGRSERDLVLARAPAHDDRDAPLPHGTWATVDVVPVVVVVVGGGAVYLPTVIVTVDFGGASVPPPGVSLSTWSLSAGSVVWIVLTLTLKPACLSSAVAVLTSAPVTSGTVTVEGPFETVSVTLVPRGADVFP